MSEGEWVGRASIDDLVDQYHEALKRAAKANAEEAAADDNRKIIRAELMVKCGDIAVTKAENVAMASADYKAAVADCREARKEAEEARAEVEWLKTRFEAWRTKTSAQKARLQHG
jgi:hypothetical protein